MTSCKAFLFQSHGFKFEPYLWPETLIETTFSSLKSHSNSGLVNGAMNPPASCHRYHRYVISESYSNIASRLLTKHCAFTAACIYLALNVLKRPHTAMFHRHRLITLQVYNFGIPEANALVYTGAMAVFHALLIGDHVKDQFSVRIYCLWNWLAFLASTEICKWPALLNGLLHKNTSHSHCIVRQLFLIE